jgi:hypothetical protein
MPPLIIVQNLKERSNSKILCPENRKMVRRSNSIHNISSRQQVHVRMDTNSIYRHKACTSRHAIFHVPHNKRTHRRNTVIDQQTPGLIVQMDSFALTYEANQYHHTLPIDGNACNRGFRPHTRQGAAVTGRHLKTHH